MSKIENITLWNGDCLKLMRDIPDESVDLILCDPPYGTLGKHPPSKWNNKENISKWDSYTIDTEQMYNEISRVLRQNGKAVLFSQEPYTSHLITKVYYPLTFCYKAIWLKPKAANILGCKTAMVNYYEDICIISKIRREEKRGNNLCKIMQQELFNNGKTIKDAKELVGASATHYFTDGQQFRIPTKEKFDILKKAGFFNIEYNYLKSQFDKFNEEYLKNLNSKYPSVFNLWEGTKLKSNILKYPKDSSNYHPTQKPVPLLEDLIKTFSDLNDTVLDFTMGSGSTGVACVNTNRKFIGIELDNTYYEIAKKRIEETIGN